MLGIHRHPKQKEFLKSHEGFLRAALIGHSQPGPYRKIAKMALFNPCMDFEFFLGQMTLFQVLWKCDLVILSKICLWLHPSAYLSINLGIKWIISRIPRGISKIIFVQRSYESLAMLDGKTRQGLFSMIQYCKITVCGAFVFYGIVNLWLDYMATTIIRSKDWSEPDFQTLITYENSK